MVAIQTNTNLRRRRTAYLAPVYSKKEVVKRCLIISFTLFILLFVLQLIQNHPNSTAISGDAVRPLGAKIPNNVLVFVRHFKTNYRAFLSQEEGVLNKLASSVSYLFDKGKKEQKRLIEEEIGANVSLLDSVKIRLQAVHQKISHLQHQALISIMGYLPYSWALFWWSMVWGGNLQLPEEISSIFKIIGMQHVVVASGYNVGLVVDLGQLPTSRFSRFYRLLILWTLIFLYVSLTDRSAAVIRAGISAALRIGAQLGLQRQLTPLRGLWMTVILMLIVRPDFLTLLSFQLSVAATLGIQWWFQPTIPAGSSVSGSKMSFSYKVWLTVKNTVIESFWGTAAAQLLTLPLILYHFGQFNGWSLVTNSLLLWCTPLLTQTGLFFSVALMVAHLFPVFSAVVNAIAFCAGVTSAPLLALFLGGATVLSRFPLGVWSNLDVPGWVPCIWGATVIMALHLRKAKLTRAQHCNDYWPLDGALVESK